MTLVHQPLHFHLLHTVGFIGLQELLLGTVKTVVDCFVGTCSGVLGSVLCRILLEKAWTRQVVRLKLLGTVSAD